MLLAGSRVMRQRYLGLATRVDPGSRGDDIQRDGIAGHKRDRAYPVRLAPLQRPLTEGQPEVMPWSRQGEKPLGRGCKPPFVALERGDPLAELFDLRWREITVAC